MTKAISRVSWKRGLALCTVLLLTSKAAIADAGRETVGAPAQASSSHQMHDEETLTLTSPFSIRDDFERENASSIGGVWTDCSDENPDLFEPLGIYKGGVVVADPFSRPGTYGSSPSCPQLLERGHIYPGIGCAYVDTGSTAVAVKVMWSGSHGISNQQPVSHVEATPLLYVTPGSSRFGFGAWPSEVMGVPILFAGYIGAPGEKFEILYVAILEGGHESGTPRELELRAEKPGEVTVWMDGEQIPFRGIGLKPIEIDPSMVNSTRHGLAIDAHCVNPPSNIPHIKGIESASIEVIESH